MVTIAPIILPGGGAIPKVLREGLCNNTQKEAALAECHNTNTLYSFIDIFRLCSKKLKIVFHDHLHQTIL